MCRLNSRAHPSASEPAQAAARPCGAAAGFTLIEMTVTLLLLTMLATVALRSASGLQDQARYEQTQERLDMIREAILGDPRKTVNGQAVVSGFVADMGRLPVCLRELIDGWNCDSGTFDAPWATGSCSVTGHTDQASCESNAGSWTANPGKMGVGWRGPYLQTSHDQTSLYAFTDGWGREDQGICSDPSILVQANCNAPAVWKAANDYNYGWWFEQRDPNNIANTDPTRLFILSYGADQAWGGGGYNAEYPKAMLPLASPLYPAPLVDSMNWLYDLTSGVHVNILTTAGNANFCGFTQAQASAFQTATSCQNAGGPSATPCTISANSCKSAGGLWQACFFTPAACGAAGGTSQTRCHFTASSCNAAGGSGSWDSTANACKVNSVQINCANAGGSWNVGTNNCDFTEGSCAVAGGDWFVDCNFSQAACAAAGGSWDTANPNSCGFTSVACANQYGQGNGSDCYMSHAEHFGVKYTPAACSAAMGAWIGETVSVCMNIYYRDPNTSSIFRAWSGPYSVNATGASATASFGDFHGSSFRFPYIPIGTAYIGIYQWDGNTCDPAATPIYPAGHALSQVDIKPQSNLPVLNW